MKKCLLKAILLAMFMVIAAFVWGQTVFYEEPFDANQGWTLEANWSITSGALKLGWSPSTTNYDLSATSPNIMVPATAGDIVISQWIDEYAGQGTTNPETYEIIAVSGGVSTVLWSYSTDADWGVTGGQDLTLSLVPFAGQTIQLKFRSTGETTFNFNYWYIYDIKAYANLDQDLSAMSLTGSAMPTIGNPYDYVITVRNTGSNSVSDYSVKLMQTGDVELGSVAGTVIAPQEIIEFTIPWTPTLLGITQIWGKVVLAGDENPNNNETEALNVLVIESGLLIAEIGEGTDVNTTTGTPAPYGTYWKNFRQQYLVLATELNDASGGAGNINSIAFNVQSLNNCSPMPNYRIRIKTTTQTALNTTFETGAYTQVFQANEFMPVAGWNTHIFSTPFNWDGASNLLIDIVTDIIPGSYSQNAAVPYTATGFNSSLRYQNDSSPAINATTGTTSVNRSNMQFVMQALDIVDMKAVTINGPATPNVGTTVNYTVAVKNYSLTAQSNYTVKLMQTGGLELASVAGTSINAQETLQFTLPWTPTTVGETQIYGKVIMVGDENPANDETERLTINVMEAGLLVIGIGTGTSTNTTTSAPAPYGTYWKAFRQQLLYKAADFYAAGGIPGMLSGLAFNVQSVGTCSAMPNYTIRLKHTDQEALGTTFETGEYTTVWQRTSFLPTADWNIHTFDQPFFWDGTSNLIVDIVTDVIAGSYTQNALVYYSNTDYASSLRYQSDSSSGSTGTTGTTSTNRSNIRFYMHAAGGDPVFIVNPSLHNFGEVNIGGSRSQNFTIINAGGGTLGINQISIAGSGTFALSNLPTLPAALETAETATFTVNYTPNSMGEDLATVTITDNQDTRHVIGSKSGLRSADNRDTHTVQLTGSGVNDITIGDGNQTARVPLDFFYKSSLFETIYTIDEMSNFVGMITGVKFYNQFTSNITATPVKIWLGSTNQTDLSAGWIPSTQMTQVFNGVVDFPSGQNIISIDFPEYYMHLDGGNLVMMVNRPLAGGYHSSSDLFKTQTVGSNRSREMHSDSTEYDPAAPTGGTVNGVFPQTTFAVIPGGVGHITGTVLGASGSPLPGVQVNVNLRPYATVTDANGQFIIPNVLPNDYAVTFSRHGYVTQTIDIVLEEEETEVMNITLNLMPQVNVTGTILASDTGLGIAGANINLIGYEDYSGSSTGNGSFTIPTVFADQSYAYSISAAGYTSTSGTIDVGAGNYNMGNITLSEIAYAPNSVVAGINAAFNAVDLNWNAPDPNAVEITESFEADTFPPADWSQIITNTNAINPIGVFPTWCGIGTINISGGNDVTPTEGSRQAGLWWDYDHQDEWLFTPSFNCPPDAYLSFDTYAKLGLPDEGHYYVKISSDGGNTWTVLWDAAAGAPGENHYVAPINLDLASYAGMEVKLAFHAEDPPSNDGLSHGWFIDNVYIGNFIRDIRSSSSKHLALKNMGSGTNRLLTGYKVWRLTAGQENNESNWISLTDDMITTLNYEDPGWTSLPNGTYKWAVKAIYTAGVMSVPALSNPLSKGVVTGNIVGFVRKAQNSQGIAGAIVSAGPGLTATTISTGFYSLNVPAGIYTVTATATGYGSLSQEDIAVAPDQNSTVNFLMVPTSNEDENVPITVTALRGNFPNPFNPETTISYDIKDAGSVSLAVYNVKGQLVRSLVNTEQAAGRYRVIFNGRDDRGKPLSSGIYLYRFTAGRYSSTRKMMLME